MTLDTIYLKAAIKLIERGDTQAALILLRYLVAIEEGDEVSLSDMDRAGEILEQLQNE